MKIFCIGNVSYDITMPIDKYPEENIKYRVNSRTECGGGPASNAAYLLGSWNLDTYFFGTIGEDQYGKTIKREFENIKINTTYMTLCKNVPTTLSLVIPNTINGSRTIITHRDKRLKYRTKKIKDVPDIILMDGEEYKVCNDVIKQFPDAITVIDAGKNSKNVISLCKKVNYIVCSKKFAEEYTKMKFDFDDNKTIIDIYKKLKEDFKNEVIVTLESMGALYLYKNELKIMPSIKVDTIDSTGAGDIFHGAFVYCLSKGYDLEKTIKISNIAGALSTRMVGTRYSIPNLEEVINIYEKL